MGPGLEVAPPPGDGSPQQFHVGWVFPGASSHFCDGLKGAHVVGATTMSQRDVEDLSLAYRVGVGHEARFVVGPFILDVAGLESARESGLQ